MNNDRIQMINLTSWDNSVFRTAPSVVGDHWMPFLGDTKIDKWSHQWVTRVRSILQCQKTRNSSCRGGVDCSLHACDCSFQMTKNVLQRDVWKKCQMQWKRKHMKTRSTIWTSVASNALVDLAVKGFKICHRQFREQLTIFFVEAWNQNVWTARQDNKKPYGYLTDASDNYLFLLKKKHVASMNEIPIQDLTFH